MLLKEFFRKTDCLRQLNSLSISTDLQELVINILEEQFTFS